MKKSLSGTRRYLRRFSTSIPLLIATASVAFAAETWVGDADNNLATPDNWAGKTAPGKDAEITFNKAGAKGTDLVNGLNAIIRKIVFTPDAGSYTFSAGNLQLAGGVINESTSAQQTFKSRITLFDGELQLKSAGGGLFIDGDIAFEKPINSPLHIVGPGSIRLGGKNHLAYRNRMGGLHVKEGATLEITGTTSLSGTGALSGNFQIGAPGSPVSRTIIPKGGTLEINGNTTAEQHGLAIGVASAGELTLNGGRVLLNHEDGSFAVGHNWVRKGTGSLNINEGSHMIVKTGKAASRGAYLIIGSNGADGTINLNGGVLETGRTFGLNGGNKSPQSGSAIFNFNGGTLKAAANNNEFFASAPIPDALSTDWWVFPVSATVIQKGGAKIDSNGFHISLNNVLAHDANLSAGLDGGLTKTGEGSLTLAGANTYNGDTHVKGGLLLINNPAGSGTGQSTIYVDQGGTLGGTGTFEGNVVVKAGGTLSPGDPVQGLSGGSLFFEKAAIYLAELDSSAIQGTEADLFIATGDLNIAEGAELVISDVARSATPFPDGKIITLVNYTGKWNNGLFTHAGKTLAEGEKFDAGLNVWQINYQSGTRGSNFIGKQKNGQFVTLRAISATSAGSLSSAGSPKMLVISIGGGVALFALVILFAMKRRTPRTA